MISLIGVEADDWVVLGREALSLFLPRIILNMRLKRGGMLNYRRYWVSTGCYFFTVNLLERKNTLLVDHIDLLRDSVRNCKQNRPFHIDTWVVLPEHMHSTAWMQKLE